MATNLLLILLSFFFCFQFLIIILYISNKNKFYFNLFVGTFAINTLLMIILSIAAIKAPEEIKKIDLSFIMWLLSGFILTFILIIKINIFVKIFKRTQDPLFYEINFFGKKVYKQSVIKQSEFIIFILTIPFFLIGGAYFIAKLINLYLYGHL